MKVVITHTIARHKTLALVTVLINDKTEAMLVSHIGEDAESPLTERGGYFFFTKTVSRAYFDAYEIYHYSGNTLPEGTEEELLSIRGRTWDDMETYLS